MGGPNFCPALKDLKWSEVKVTQSHLTLCDPMDYKVHGILLARILEWVAFPCSGGSSQPRDRYLKVFDSCLLLIRWSPVSFTKGTNWLLDALFFFSTPLCWRRKRWPAAWPIIFHWPLSHTWNVTLCNLTCMLGFLHSMLFFFPFFIKLGSFLSFFSLLPISSILPV